MVGYPGGTSSLQGVFADEFVVDESAESNTNCGTVYVSTDFVGSYCKRSFGRLGVLVLEVRFDVGTLATTSHARANRSLTAS